jgi:hypothetical protein
MSGTNRTCGTTGAISFNSGAHPKCCGTATLPRPRKPSHKSTGRGQCARKINDATLNGFFMETVFLRQLIALSKSTGTLNHEY